MMASLSGIVKQLSKERDRLHQQLSGLNAALEAFAGSTEAPEGSGLDGRYQPKAVLVLPQLRKHVGRRQKASQKLPRNEQCQPQRGERSQRHSGRGGPRLKGNESGLRVS